MIEMDILRLAGIAIVTATVSATVRELKPELGLQAAIAGGAVMLAVAADGLFGIVSALNAAFGEAGFDPELPRFVLRVTGTAYTAQLASDICRDANETALASRTEICGRIAITALSLPWLLRFLRSLTELIGEIL